MRPDHSLGVNIPVIFLCFTKGGEIHSLNKMTASDYAGSHFIPVTNYTTDLNQIRKKY
jgi:hypothetical protein